MKHSSFSHIFAATAVLVALVAVGGFGRLLYGLLDDRAALAQLQFAYDDAAQKSTYAASIHTLLRDLDDERKTLVAITQGYDPVEAIRVIEDAARLARVTVVVNAVTPGMPPPEDPTLSTFLLNMEVTGSFERLHRFTALMESLPLPMEIDQARFDKLDKTWTGSMIIRVYMESTNES